MMTETTTAQDWTEAQAVAHDAELARLSEAAYAVQERAEALADRAVHAAGARMAFVNGGGKGMSLDGRNRTSWSDVLAVAAGTLAPGRYANLEALAGYVAEHAAAVEELRSARAAARDHDAAGYRGWPRFFLVPDGHIHRSTACSSLRITTRIGWLPALSGKTEAAAVEAHGAMLCTKCFPSAPVEWTRGKVDPDQCPSVTPARGDGRRRRYANCDECGYHGALTSTGRLRKHKRAN